MWCGERPAAAASEPEARALSREADGDEPPAPLLRDHVAANFEKCRKASAAQHNFISLAAASGGRAILVNAPNFQAQTASTSDLVACSYARGRRPAAVAAGDRQFRSPRLLSGEPC